MDLEKLNSCDIDINCGMNINNLYEYYKSIISKIVLANENTLYKTFDKKIRKNLNSGNCNEILSSYLKLTIQLINDNKDEDLNNLITKIQMINNDNISNIVDKIIHLINEYYYYLDRSKLNIDSVEKYNDSLIKYFKEFYNYNKLEILTIIKDK